MPAVLLVSVLMSCAPGSPIDGHRLPIVGGREATAADATGVVALVERSDAALVCTGTLIEPDVVLTAAHCVALRDPAELAVVAGALVVDGASPRHVVRDVVVHPGYPGPLSTDPALLGDDRDIAVLVLAGIAGETTPVAVLPAERVPIDLAAGEPLTLAGYGATRTDGMPPYGVLHVGETVVSRRNDTELLAGEGATADTCYVDSGGPAFTDLDGTRHLAAITSRASGLATTPCGDGTLFTLAPVHSDFIRSAVAAVRSRDDDGGCAASSTSEPGASWLALALALCARRLRTGPGSARATRRHADATGRDGFRPTSQASSSASGAVPLSPKLA
jgi:trypsin